MASLSWLIVAHGGIYGAAGETVILLAILLFLGWIWFGERRRRQGRNKARMRE